MTAKEWGLFVNILGGLHEFGPLWICIHDDGLSVAWRQVEKIDWRCRP